MLAYTGARRSEIAGPLETDIGQDADIHFLHIRENHLRGLKNRFSRRRIPLHPHLIELGLLKFVAEKRNSNDLVLFPEAIPAKIRVRSLQVDGDTPPYDKKFGDSLDHVWRESLKRSLNGNPEQYCLASLRGFVNDTLINLRTSDGNTLLVREIDRLDILGHRPRDVNEATYRRDERSLGPLNVAISLLPRLFRVDLYRLSYFIARHKELGAQVSVNCIHSDIRTSTNPSKWLFALGQSPACASINFQKSGP